jgi:hypothetical protein
MSSVLQAPRPKTDRFGIQQKIEGSPFSEIKFANLSVSTSFLGMNGRRVTARSEPTSKDTSSAADAGWILAYFSFPASPEFTPASDVKIEW